MRPPLLITGPSVEPLSLAEFLAHGNVDTTTAEQETMIEEIFIPAAREYLEDRTGRTFHQKTLEWIFDEWPSFGQPFSLDQATPLIAITSLKYKDATGSETTLSPSLYLADTDSLPGQVMPPYNTAWPSLVLYPVSPIRIRGTCGIADASPLTEPPASVKYAISLLVTGFFENRESEVVTDKKAIDAISMKYGVEAFISSLRVSYAF